MPIVKVYDSASGNFVREFLAYSSEFTGGVTVALGDVNGDGIEDVITGAGIGGGPHVKVFDGKTGDQIANFFAYDPDFRGGVFVAAGTFGFSLRQSIVTGAGAGGGPHVRTWEINAGTATPVGSFMAYDPSFRGGVTVAAADLNGDGIAEIVAGQGPGGGPRVSAFQESGSILASYFAYDPDFHGGVFVAAGSWGGSAAVIVTGPGSGGAPHVFAIDGKSLLQNGNTTAVAIANFYAGDASRRDGVRVALKDLNGDNRADVITGAGTNAGSKVMAYLGSNAKPYGTPLSMLDFNAFADFTGGVFVG